MQKNSEPSQPVFPPLGEPKAAIVDGSPSTVSSPASKEGESTAVDLGQPPAPSPQGSASGQGSKVPQSSFSTLNPGQSIFSILGQPKQVEQTAGPQQANLPALDQKTNPDQAPSMFQFEARPDHAGEKTATSHPLSSSMTNQTGAEKTQDEGAEAKIEPELTALANGTTKTFRPVDGEDSTLTQANEATTVPSTSTTPPQERSGTSTPGLDKSIHRPVPDAAAPALPSLKTAAADFNALWGSAQIESINFATTSAARASPVSSMGRGTAKSAAHARKAQSKKLTPSSPVRHDDSDSSVHSSDLEDSERHHSAKRALTGLERSIHRPLPDVSASPQLSPGSFFLSSSAPVQVIEDAVAPLIAAAPNVTEAAALMKRMIEAVHQSETTMDAFVTL